MRCENILANFRIYRTVFECKMSKYYYCNLCRIRERKAFANDGCRISVYVFYIRSAEKIGNDKEANVHSDDDLVVKYKRLQIVPANKFDAKNKIPFLPSPTRKLVYCVGWHVHVEEWLSISLSTITNS